MHDISQNVISTTIEKVTTSFCVNQSIQTVVITSIDRSAYEGILVGHLFEINTTLGGNMIAH